MRNVDQVFQARFELLLSSGLASQASISAALDILDHVEQHTGICLNEALGAPLATHLAVTLQRLLQGELLQTAPDVLWQELKGYPAQLDLAATLISELKQRLGVQMPPDEAGFLALHLARIVMAVELESGKPNPPSQEGG